ncbi:phospholipid-transporting ATPase ID-like isoform X2 [Styela clava]
MGDCFPEKVPEETRYITANDPEYNAQFNYKKNKIITSRYTVLTFLPLNLFQQFQRVANAYFLMLLILQLIPAISSLSPITTIIPLVVVLSVTAVKDAVDDFHRHQSDDEINNRKTLTLRNGKLEEVKWMDSCVGDLVKLENNQFVTADILLLSSSDENNLVYIETAELDGETNLKVKQAIPDTGMIGDDIRELSKFNGEITCESPNEILHKFGGKMQWNDQEYPLDNEKILLRGCRVRNTDWCIGIVIFAGPDTKLMMNTGKTILKRTSIDRLMNTLVWMIFGFLLTLATTCAIGNTIWESQIGIKFTLYQPWEDYITNIYMSGFLAFWSYIIILNTVVPISLYVSVEVIRLMQSWFIDWDRQMYYGKKDLPAHARTTTLNEELGQIEYIFSDKTGTLTQNVMVFKKCSINGKSYGSLYDNQGNRIQPDETTPIVDLSFNSYYERKFVFHDQDLVDKMRSDDEHCHNFFRLVALCHTVMPEIKEDESLVYQAQSPDENALVSAARNFGFVFVSRTFNTITVKEMGNDVEYEVLAILDFDNVRKRMSVIVRSPDGQITLFCKGADSVIYERLKADENAEMNDLTSEHLEDFATDGLRTLCLAMKKLDPEVYDVWKIRHQEALTAIDDRDDMLAAVYEEIERDMTLLGATAIEDKLQDGVPETIANLTRANIKIWVLTGDKQETAINIGYSCNMLTEDMKDVFVISTGSLEEVRESIESALSDIRDTSANQNDVQGTTSTEEFVSVSNSANTMLNEDAKYGLVINGYSLAHALLPELEELFLELATFCSTVICCRVTPLQKAQVVELVKKYKSAVTLSIGDGANDVSMIKAAHIGVGISGEEGTQAVLSSDFSFGQFRYLERLLLVHGRWSYMRMCKFLGYFFYKNFAFTLVHFWYAFFCGFQAQTVYDEKFVASYNVIYSSFPIICIGLFEQDLNDAYCIRFPKLYLPGQKNEGFNKKIFFLSIVRGILTSLVLFFFTYGAFHTNSATDGADITNVQSVGTVIATSLIIIVNLKVGMDTQYWTPINHFFVWGSIAIFFVMSFALYSDGLFYLSPETFPYIGAARNTMNDGNMWFTVLLTTTVCVLPELAIKLFYEMLYPSYNEEILKKQVKDRKLRKKKTKSSTLSELAKFKDHFLIKRKGSNRPRSGYAFSHEKGFGDLITTGRMSMRNKSQSAHGTPKSENRSEHIPVTEELHEATNAENIPKNGDITQKGVQNSDSYHTAVSDSNKKQEHPTETYRKLAE